MSSERFLIAAQWIVRLGADDIKPEEFSSWVEWYEADPLNRAAFEEAQATLESTRTLGGDDRARLAKSLLARRTGPPAHALGATWERLRLWSRAYSIPFSAGAVAVALVGLAVWISLPEHPGQVTATFQTSIATHRSEQLSDGSVVHLGARSSVVVSYSGETRYVVLESGEAFFKVAKDSTRPFVVQAGLVSVRAVGTEFNVRRAGDSTTVGVKEGVVEVTRKAAESAAVQHAWSDVRLSAGQMAVLPTRADPVVKQIHRAGVSGWQSGRLEFFNEPLPQVVATLNRYSAREIVVTDPVLESLRLTGSIDGRNITEWLQALPDIFPVKVNDIGKTTVLISPAAAS